MKVYNIAIRGVVETNISNEAFLNEFLSWIEYKGFRFYGLSREVDDDGDAMGDNVFAEVD